MLRVTIIEVFLRGIPEGFLMILAGYLYSNKRIDKKKLIISSIILSIVPFIVRFLPIHFGVHTIILIASYIVIVRVISKFELVKAITSALISTIVLFVCEAVNVFVLLSIFKLKLEIVFSKPLSKILYSSPSLLLFGLIVFSYYKQVYKKRRLADNVVLD